MLDPHYYYFMDWDFWLRAGLRSRIAYVPAVWSTYRLHPESKTVAQAAKAAPELEYMYRQYFARDDVPASIRSMQRLAMANMYLTSGGYYLKGGDRGSAARMGLRAANALSAGPWNATALHKILYCLLGDLTLYKAGRYAYHCAGALHGARRPSRA